jgi:dihydrofolate synthase/folylpolyglutamate synthase
MVSPHVYDIRERVQINGQMISERKFHAFTNILLNELQGFKPSYFEVLTCLGFLVSSRESLDYMIVETGFGGLWDVTNAINSENKLCVISQIGYDHTAILGDTLKLIAAQKAGIIQESSQVIVGDQPHEALDVITEYAGKKHAPVTISKKYEDYQNTNDELAKTTVIRLAERDGWEYDEALAEKTISKIFIPGRFEKRLMKDQLVILDGAHNPQKLEAMVRRLQSEKLDPATFIFAVGLRKDWKRCLEVLKPAAKRIIATEFYTDQADTPHKAVSAKEVANTCKELGIESKALKKAQNALHEALKYPESIVATGSFYLLAEIDKAF